MVQAGYDYSRHWEPSSVVEPRTKVVKKTHKKVNGKRKFVLKLIALAFIYGLILVYICIKSATLGYQIIALEQDIKGYEASNNKLQYYIQENCSLDKIELMAINDLGMNRPNSHLAVALSNNYNTTTEAVNQTDEIDISVVEEKPLYKLYSNLLILAEKN